MLYRNYILPQQDPWKGANPPVFWILEDTASSSRGLGWWFLLWFCCAERTPPCVQNSLSKFWIHNFLVWLKDSSISECRFELCVKNSVYSHLERSGDPKFGRGWFFNWPPPNVFVWRFLLKTERERERERPIFGEASFTLIESLMESLIESLIYIFSRTLLC